jgi:hypothetical protein
LQGCIADSAIILVSVGAFGALAMARLAGVASIGLLVEMCGAFTGFGGCIESSILVAPAVETIVDCCAIAFFTPRITCCTDIASSFVVPIIAETLIAF